MLYDEKDLKVFKNEDSKLYFKEILQTYYSQNYRASVVLLYSFVIYDLFIKMQQMGEEGDHKASQKVLEINQMIENDEKYSKVEVEIISYFKDNYSTYFAKFIQDIEYLKNCRNNSAHLKVDDNSLYIPKDYQVKMLICSMYDNLFSVDAPFITDLFSIVQNDVEWYTSNYYEIREEITGEEIIKKLSNKYFRRMTKNSLKKSYKTFAKIMFKSKDENAIDNVTGLFVFIYSMTDYLLKSGQHQLFLEKIIDINQYLDIENLIASDSRKNYLITLILNFEVLLNQVKENQKIFNYLSDCVLSSSEGLVYYNKFFPESSKTGYDYFKENKVKWSCYEIYGLYNSLEKFDNFDLNEYTEIMIDRVSNYNGFGEADYFTSFFIEHFDDLSEDVIKEIIKKYNVNTQCYRRSRHKKDADEIQRKLEERDINIKIRE